MSASLFTFTRRSRVAVIAIGTALAIAIPAASASASAASSHPSSPAISATVRCTKRLPMQPPPLGVIKPQPGRPLRIIGKPPAPVAAPSPKPVCPAGEVPVIKNVVLPHGNPDQAVRLRRGATSQALIEQPCEGTEEYGGCYYWANATDNRNDQGGGVTMTIENPSVVPTPAVGTGHSLEEMSVQGGPDDGNIVEIGSTVLSGTDYPQLFVYHWLGWKGTCYNGCGWQQYSSTYYPGMPLLSMVGDSVYNGYVFYQGYWWAWFNDQWLGRFPASIWDGQFEQSQQVQWFGEVAATAGVPPQTQMGNGLFPSNPAAAPMSTLCDVNAAAWRCYYYNQQTLFQSDATFYTNADTGYGATRLGGPGS
jgi:neprosin-like protein